MFFDFPDDMNCFDDIEHTFMVGDSVKVSPILQKGFDDFNAYFPAGKWAYLNPNSYSMLIDSTGQQIPLKASVSYVNLHLKAGRIIPFQENIHSATTTTDFVEQTPMSFIIFRDDSDHAEGNILIDDGISQ